MTHRKPRRPETSFCQHLKANKHDPWCAGVLNKVESLLKDVPGEVRPDLERRWSSKNGPEAKAAIAEAYVICNAKHWTSAAAEIPVAVNGKSRPDVLLMGNGEPIAIEVTFPEPEIDEGLLLRVRTAFDDAQKRVKSKGFIVRVSRVKRGKGDLSPPRLAAELDKVLQNAAQLLADQASNEPSTSGQSRAVVIRVPSTADTHPWELEIYIRRHPSGCPDAKSEMHVYSLGLFGSRPDKRLREVLLEKRKQHADHYRRQVLVVFWYDDESSSLTPDEITWALYGSHTAQLDVHFNRVGMRWNPDGLWYSDDKFRRCVEAVAIVSGTTPWEPSVQQMSLFLRPELTKSPFEKWPGKTFRCDASGRLVEG